MLKQHLQAAGAALNTCARKQHKQRSGLHATLRHSHLHTLGCCTSPSSSDASTNARAHAAAPSLLCCAPLCVASTARLTQERDHHARSAAGSAAPPAPVPARWHTAAALSQSCSCTASSWHGQRACRARRAARTCAPGANGVSIDHAAMRTFSLRPGRRGRLTPAAPGPALCALQCWPAGG